MIQVTAVKQFRNGNIGLFVDDCADVPNGVCRTLAGPLKLVERELFTVDTSPAPISLNATAAQKLMDDLWNCGIRPTEGSGSAGSFTAQGRHLEDMRKLVFMNFPAEDKADDQKFNKTS